MECAFVGYLKMSAMELTASVSMKATKIYVRKKVNSEVTALLLLDRQKSIQSFAVSLK
jgi:hypothetical protein